MSTPSAPPDAGPPQLAGTPETWGPCVIGDPGRAAGTVVPRPDPVVPERPDTVVDGYAVPGSDGHPAIEVRAASVRGLAHRYYGRVRQDAYTVRISHDGRWVVVAVADGVSAGPHSHIAADAAVVVAGRELADLLTTTPPERLPWAPVLGRIADAVAGDVAWTMDRFGEAPADDVAEHGAATLLIAVIPTEADERGGRDVHLIGVGDCSAWVLAAHTWQRVSGGKDDGGVYASAATAALPALPPVPPEPVAARLEPGEVLAVVSDGVGDPLGDGSGEVGTFLAAHWSTPPQPLAFAAQVDFARRSHDDDRTAVVLWPVTR